MDRAVSVVRELEAKLKELLGDEVAFVLITIPFADSTLPAGVAQMPAVPKYTSNVPYAYAFDLLAAALERCGELRDAPLADGEGRW